MLADPGLERRAFPIAHGLSVEDFMRRLDSALRGTRGGLAEFHMNDRPPGRLQFVGEAADGDGLEGGDVLAQLAARLGSQVARAGMAATRMIMATCRPMKGTAPRQMSIVLISSGAAPRR